MRGSWLHGSNKLKVLTSFKGYRASGSSLRGSWLQRSNMSKVLTSFKGSRASEFCLRGSWLQRSNMSKFLRVSKVLGLQVSKVEGDPGLIMRFKVFRRSLKVNGFRNFLIQGLQGSKG